MKVHSTRKKRYTLTIQKRDGAWFVFAWFNFEKNANSLDRIITHRAFVVTAKWSFIYDGWRHP